MSEIPYAVPAGVTVDQKPYRPFGHALELLYAHDPELLFCGPSGTGKSRACLEKIYLCACKYPGMRALFIRKTRESCTQSVMTTFDKFVIPRDGSVKWRTAEQEYRLNNGSKIIVGGMDKASKVLSSEYDLIYANEATELSLVDWETLITRCRYGVMPYNQLIADCNPDAPTHWLKARCDAGKTRMIYSRHEDNPTLYDPDKAAYTEKGKNYLSKLDQLTGVRFQRYRLGVWAAAEGLIYDEFDPEVHIVNRFPVPREWQRVWAVDFGFTHPLTLQVWAVDGDGRMYLVNEWYRTRTLVEDICAEVRAWMVETGEPKPLSVVCDWDEEGRFTVERHLGVDTVNARKDVITGIEAVKSRLKVQADKKPRLYLMKDTVLERDVELIDSKLPTCLAEELTSYVWADTKKKDEPLKVCDHGCDAMRYAVAQVDLNLSGWARGMRR